MPNAEPDRKTKRIGSSRENVSCNSSKGQKHLAWRKLRLWLIAQRQAISTKRITNQAFCVISSRQLGIRRLPPSIVHVIGTGAIRSLLTGILADMKDLGIDEFTLAKQTPLLNDRSNALSLTGRGTALERDHPRDAFYPWNTLGIDLNLFSSAITGDSDGYSIGR